jgi:hypothetical protein
MDSFNSFNISFIPQDKNQKADSLAVASFLFNPNDSQRENRFCVKRISMPSIPDNQYHLQFFENDEQVDDFLSNSNDSTESIDDQTRVFVSIDCIIVESFFRRDDQRKNHHPKEETSITKCHYTQKINIGTHDCLKYINLGTSCTKEEIDQYTSLFK